jgi:hypothetical protein
MVAIDLGKIADPEALAATAWNLKLTGAQTETAQKWLRDGGQAGKIYSWTESAWRELNPGKPIRLMPVDLPEQVFQISEPGRPLRKDEVKKMVSYMALQGEGFFGDTLGEAIQDGPEAVRAVVILFYLF